MSMHLNIKHRFTGDRSVVEVVSHSPLVVRWHGVDYEVDKQGLIDYSWRVEGYRKASGRSYESTPALQQLPPEIAREVLRDEPEPDQD